MMRAFRHQACQQLGISQRKGRGVGGGSRTGHPAGEGPRPGHWQEAVSSAPPSSGLPWWATTGESQGEGGAKNRRETSKAPADWKGGVCHFPRGLTHRFGSGKGCCPQLWGLQKMWLQMGRSVGKPILTLGFLLNLLSEGVNGDTSDCWRMGIASLSRIRLPPLPPTFSVLPFPPALVSSTQHSNWVLCFS